MEGLGCETAAPRRRSGLDGLPTRVVPKQSWSDLVTDYNLATGRAWPLVLAWIAIGPAAMARVAPPKEPDARP
jgi:hypothetical protein